MFDHMEPVDYDSNPAAQHFAHRCCVAVPHVGGHFLQLREKSRGHALFQPPFHRGFIACFQHVQNSLVGVIDQDAAELPVSFFKESSSMPSDRTGSSCGRGWLCLASTCW